MKELLLSRNLSGDKTIIVQPFASNIRRTYDIKQLQKALVLCTQTDPNLKFLVLLHSTDFNKDYQWEFKNILTIKDYDIVHIAAIMHHVSMVVCPDSAILHLAGALSKKIVAYFGPTDARARMYPNMKALWPGEVLPLSPLWYGGSDFQALETWRQLTPEMLAIAILEQYNSKQLVITPSSICELI